MSKASFLKGWLVLTAVTLAGCGASAPEDKPQSSAIQILQAEPGFMHPGDTEVEVTLRGRGFAPGARVEFLISDTGNPAQGLTVHSVDFVDAETLKVSLSADAQAPPSILDVRVVVGQRSGSGTELFGVASKS
ncbi:MAG TPA: hypothetical protein VLV83_10970 [Acidobacteriota bacterium]|nr:hypothetical protein [Acidobacteriota bacterium]